MSIFEEKLNSATIIEDVDVKVLFESFLLKRSDSPYGFINLTSDLEDVSEYRKEDPRYVVRSKQYHQQRHFLKMKTQVVEGKIHCICAKITSEKDNLNLVVFGHEEYEIFKKFVQLFIAKFPEVSVQLKLDTPNVEFVYAEVKTIGFWQLLKERFVYTKITIDGKQEPAH